MGMRPDSVPSIRRHLRVVRAHTWQALRGNTHTSHDTTTCMKVQAWILNGALAIRVRSARDQDDRSFDTWPDLDNE